MIRIDHLKSYAKKREKDFEWVEDAHKIYSSSLNLGYAERARLRFKYDLSVGYMPKMNPRLYNQLSIRDNFGYDIREFMKVPHQPMINTIIESLVGERQRMPFEPMAVDIGMFSMNEKRRLHTSMLQDYLKERIMVPLNERVGRQYFMENGIADLTQVSHEDQQQIQSDIRGRVAEQTPEKINEYFNNEYYSAFSEEAQQLLEHEKNRMSLKFLYEDSFKHGLISNKEIQYISERHMLPFMERVNPEWFAWEGSADCPFFEDGDAAHYRAPRTYMDIFSRYGDKIKPGDVSKIGEMSSYDRKGFSLDTMFDSRREYQSNDPVMESRIIGFYSENEHLFPEGINQNSGAHQELILALKSRFGNDSGVNGPLIEDSHVVFRTTNKVKLITRDVKGRLEYSWRDSDYVCNPDVGDVEEKNYITTDIMQARRLGSERNGVFIDKGPLPFQWTDPDNPYSRKLPYFGGWHNKLMGNTSIDMGNMDRGINLQLQFNIESARLSEERSYNMGKVFTMLMSMKPDKYSWPEFIETIRGSRIVPIDDSKLTSQASIAMAAGGRILQSLDLSNEANVAGAMQHMENIFRNMQATMGWNPLRNGGGSPYSSNATNQQNYMAATNQTYDVHSAHAKLMENSLNGYMEQCRRTYRNFPKTLRWITDDMTAAELTLSEEWLAYAKMGVVIRSSVEDQDSMRELKLETMNFIQNQNAHLISTIARIKFAKTPAQILNIGDRLAKKIAEENAQNQKAQLAVMQEDAKKKEQMELAKLQNAQKINQDKIEGNLGMAALEQDSLYDIDHDDRSDLLEKTDKEIAYKERKDAADRELEREKMKSQEKIAAQNRNKKGDGGA